MDGDNDDEDLGFGNFDGDRTATFRDADGSVTKCPGDNNWHGPVQIVKPEKFLITERCKYRTNHNMVICNDIYGKVSQRLYTLIIIGMSLCSQTLSIPNLNSKYVSVRRQKWQLNKKDICQMRPMPNKCKF